MLDDDLAALSDPARDQYFLTNPAKLQLILDTADIRQTDSVIEIGSGVGTVARVLPRCSKLTLIELDYRLIPALRSNAPEYASILNADGLAILGDNRLRTDVILGNVPSDIALDLAALLPRLDFRIAVIAAGSVGAFESLDEQLESTVLAAVQGNDFTPPQPGTSYLVSVRLRRPGAQ